MLCVLLIKVFAKLTAIGVRSGVRSLRLHPRRQRMSIGVSSLMLQAPSSVGDRVTARILRWLSLECGRGRVARIRLEGCLRKSGQSRVGILVHLLVLDKGLSMVKSDGATSPRVRWPIVVDLSSTPAANISSRWRSFGAVVVLDLAGKV